MGVPVGLLQNLIGLFNNLLKQWVIVNRVYAWGYGELLWNLLLEVEHCFQFCQVFHAASMS